MLRRKLGILFLVGITVLAGTQEAARQFDGLKSSLKNFTRASLWSGLIVYAQPVSDGKLPAPQIYYLMPSPQQPQPFAPAAQQPVLADNASGATTANPDARNNHGAEAAEDPAAAHLEAATLVASHEAEDAAKSELALNALPLNLIASHLVAPKAAPKPERARIYEEVAKHEALAARRFREAGTAAGVFVKEFDAETLVAEAERLVAEQGQLEQLKAKMPAELANLHRRTELRIVRRPATRTERLERIRVMAPFNAPHGTALLETSSVGCENPRATPRPAAPVAAPPAPLAKRSTQILVAPEVELGLPAMSNPTGNSWTLNCDTEPEQK